MIKKHNMLARMVPTSWSDEAEAATLLKAQTMAREGEYYWKYFTGHMWDVKFEGHAIRYDGSVDPPSVVWNEGWGEAAIKEYMANTDMKGFDPNYFTSHGRISREVCGLGLIGGPNSLINVARPVCADGTYAHEFGHNVGLYHTGKLREDGVATEYGDDTCIMGGGADTLKGFCSPNMLKLNMDSARERITVESTTELLMCPIEVSHHSLREHEYQHVILKMHNRDDIVVSLRMVRGTRFPVNERYEGTLFAHQIMPDRSIKRIMPDMEIGSDPWTLPNGVTIHYHEYKFCTASVTFVYPGDRTPMTYLEIPELFPEPLPGAHINELHSGAWYKKAYDGQGLDIYIKDREVVLYWYTYGDRGVPVWYTAKGYIEDNCAFMTIYKSSGGTWNNPSLSEAEPIGEGQLYFFDQGRGVFNYITDNYDRGSIEITPVVLTNHQMDGAWFDRSKDGSGMGLRFFERKLEGVLTKQCTGFWYSYDDSGNLVWFTLQGVYEADNYEIKIREFRGGRWMYYDKPTGTIVGTATLGRYSMVFDYDIVTANISDSGSLNLSRLF